MVINKILWGKLTQENVSFYPKYIYFLLGLSQLIVTLLFLTALETSGC